MTGIKNPRCAGIFLSEIRAIFPHSASIRSIHRAYAANWADANPSAFETVYYGAALRDAPIRAPKCIPGSHAVS